MEFSAGIHEILHRLPPADFHQARLACKPSGEAASEHRYERDVQKKPSGMAPHTGGAYRHRQHTREDRPKSNEPP